MATAYIAGPMRGLADYNFPAFDAASAFGRNLGWTIISPAEMDRAHGFDERGATGNETISPAKLREFMERDIAAILSLRAEDGDAVAMLPGWQDSRGATAERALALWAGLKVLDAATFEPLI